MHSRGDTHCSRRVRQRRWSSERKQLGLESKSRECGDWGLLKVNLCSASGNVPLQSPGSQTGSTILMTFLPEDPLRDVFSLADKTAGVKTHYVFTAISPQDVRPAWFLFLTDKSHPEAQLTQTGHWSPPTAGADLCDGPRGMGRARFSGEHGGFCLPGAPSPENALNAIPCGVARAHLHLHPGLQDTGPGPADPATPHPVSTGWPSSCKRRPSKSFPKVKPSHRGRKFSAR